MLVLKRISLIIIFLQILGLQFVSAQQYNPRFWTDESEELPKVIKTGWGGILYWGASFEDDKMNYYFPSKYLESQTWAKKGEDRLTRIVSTAHQNNIKVMVNMEGVNPYHWTKNQWNKETIASTITDLANNGIDAVFEECFEANPDAFLSLANTLKKKNVDYISGTDPMLLREYSFKQLWPSTSIINTYNYYLKRDKNYAVATLAQNGSLGLGWAKFWGKPTSMMSPITRDWGIDMQKSPAVVSYLAMIRALQFRIDNFLILGGLEKFDPQYTKDWINEFVKKQTNKRPLMNIVVLLDEQDAQPSSEESGWNKLFNSGDAITTGAFHAGYDVIVSDKVVPADAYWIYIGKSEKDLPKDVRNLFDSNKKVFLQSSGYFPSGKLSKSWYDVLFNCGVNAKIAFKYAGGSQQVMQASLPEDQEFEIPYTGYYKENYFRFTGVDVQRGKDFRDGIIITDKSITGNVISSPNSTYGKGPFVVGKNNKYLITASTIHWQTNFLISDLLSGGGTLPSSNVWGIVGSDVSALLAIEDTELDLQIPGLKDGTKLHYEIWDSNKKMREEKTIVYQKKLIIPMKEYDLILIDRK